MTPSLAEATAAARRIAEMPPSDPEYVLRDFARDVETLKDFVLAEDTERLREALAEVDRLASVAHDAIWHKDVQCDGCGFDVLHANDRDDSAQSAIWAIHELVRPLLAEGSA